MRISSEYTYRRMGCGLEIEHVPTGKTRWLQGDDADEAENACEHAWKLAQRKKMGWSRASLIVDDYLSNYFE